MSPSLGLQQTLKQQLTLSPQLIQTFEILAMSSLELQQKIKAEIEQNPAIEIPTERSVSIERISEQESRKSPDDELSDTTSYDPDRYRSDVRLSSHYDQESADRNQQFLEGALAKSETLQESLMRQLGCLRLSEQQRELGMLIISNLDHNGFHKNPPETLVKADARKMLLAMLPIVQSLDPPGVGATDFRESLVLQAKADNLAPEDLEHLSSIVYDHLELLRLNKTKEVAKTMGIAEEDVQTLYRYLKTLNPFPGLQYDSIETHYVIPDLIVRMIDGRLQLRLNTENIPTISIDPEFTSLATDPRDKAYKETTAYINNAVKSATQLMTQINMRSETMKKIGLELLKFQHEFFLQGPRYLRPLTYRQIAEDLSLHETTISRAVQGKYIDTDWGIIPIKELFSSALQATTPGEEDVSKRAVMDMVREIIDEHTGDKPLSDQKIADMLENKGIKIARRTVSKYRKALHIDSSYERTT
ncbi:MAG: RNA polymerase factor sigma-54 [Sphaerochaeta sp.]|nr:RNA polymerase factor sigma-54 [Sphaerochaeta sp.]